LVPHIRDQVTIISRWIRPRRLPVPSKLITSTCLNCIVGEKSPRSKRR
jgi:hypothetical protein